MVISGPGAATRRILILDRGIPGSGCRESPGAGLSRGRRRRLRFAACTTPCTTSLQERVKELTALHRTARLLQDVDRPLEAVVADVLALVPGAWQYPEIATARVVLGEEGWATPGHVADALAAARGVPPARRRGRGAGGGLPRGAPAGRRGAVPGRGARADPLAGRDAAGVLAAPPRRRGDPRGERAARAPGRRPHGRPAPAGQRAVPGRGARAPRDRVATCTTTWARVSRSCGRGCASSRAMRRWAATSRPWTSCSHLVDQSISYTRSLTFELSPPILYELGLGPALEWLGEQVAEKHGLRVKVRDRCRRDLPDDLRVIFFRSARELLQNVVKHAGAKRVGIELACRDGRAGTRRRGRRLRRGPRPRDRRRATTTASACSASRSACASSAAASSSAPRPAAAPARASSPPCPEERRHDDPHRAGRRPQDVPRRPAFAAGGARRLRGRRRGRGRPGRGRARGPACGRTC